MRCVALEPQRAVAFLLGAPHRAYNRPDDRIVAAQPRSYQCLFWNVLMNQPHKEGIGILSHPHPDEEPSAPPVLPKQMLALYVTDAGPHLRHDAPLPLPGKGEALVRVRLAGICSTDLHILRGYKGGFRGILGHEFVGEVVWCPDNRWWEQRRVVAEINIGCGTCALCARGLHKHCRARQALGIKGHDGVFAEYVVAPIANLHEVHPKLPDRAAVFTEPVAAALQIGEQIALRPAMRVIVLGDGRLGQLVAQALFLSCPDTTLVGRTREKLAIAALRGIATATLEQMPGLQEHPADLVVECTGSPEGFAAALTLVQPAGVIVLKSTFGEPVTSDLTRLAVDEVTVIGSRCGPFAPALELLRTRRIDPRPLISAVYPLAEAPAALTHAAQKGVLKVLLQMPSGESTT
jgi:threonine dehydrogenase-like Zn-dependent dehydrogenase